MSSDRNTFVRMPEVHYESKPYGAVIVLPPLIQSKGKPELGGSPKEKRKLLRRLRQEDHLI